MGRLCRLFILQSILTAFLLVDLPDRPRAMIVQREEVCSFADRNLLVLGHEVDQDRPLLIADLDVRSHLHLRFFIHFSQLNNLISMISDFTAV